MLQGKTIGVIGGTGAEGSGLAMRWARAGLAVVIGSRDAARAEAVAGALNAALLDSALGRPLIGGLDNLAAASVADIVVLSVPFAGQQATALEIRAALAGKVLVDVTVPLVPPKVDRVQLPGGRSAVEQLAERLGPEVTVVSAFQHVSATHLKDADFVADCDVLVCGDTKAGRDVAVALAEAAGMRGIHAGMLVNSAAIEAMTSVLIAINRRYKVPGAGIRITGLPATLPAGA